MSEIKYVAGSTKSVRCGVGNTIPKHKSSVWAIVPDPFFLEVRAARGPFGTINLLSPFLYA